MLSQLARALLPWRPDQADRYEAGIARALARTEAERREALNRDLKTVWPDTAVSEWGPVPLARDLWDLHAELLDLEYSMEARSDVLTHASLHGTLQCCRAVDPEHLDRLEATLPGNPWHWGPETDLSCAALGPGEGLAAPDPQHGPAGDAAGERYS